MEGSGRGTGSCMSAEPRGGPAGSQGCRPPPPPRRPFPPGGLNFLLPGVLKWPRRGRGGWQRSVADWASTPPRHSSRPPNLQPTGSAAARSPTTQLEQKPLPSRKADPKGPGGGLRPSPSPPPGACTPPLSSAGCSLPQDEPLPHFAQPKGAYRNRGPVPRQAIVIHTERQPGASQKAPVKKVDSCGGHSHCGPKIGPF